MTSSGTIVGVGMTTPLGLDARQSALVLRARKLTPERTRYTDRYGHEIGSARARRVDDAVVGRERRLALAAPALAEAVRGVVVPSGPMPLFLSLPVRRSEKEEPLGPDFLADLAARAGVPIALEQSEPIALGHAGFAAALGRALAYVSAPPPAPPAGRPRGEKPPRPFAIVGGVDSYHDPAVLKWLDDERRLHREDAWDGFIPSEAAAFLVVAPAGTGPAYARILSVVTGVEREETAEDPPVGEAATELLRQVSAAMKTPVPWILPDVNGENHRIKEYTFVRIRNPERFDGARTVETRLYDELGDVGAASGAVHAAYVCQAFRLGFAPGPQALVTLASDGPPRGAFALEAT
jgi:3-oxoacyl-[acyl-carrier-protein] synthase I